MSSKRDYNIKYPYEYLAAQVEFGVKVLKVTKGDPRKVFNKYTCLYGTLSNHRFADKGENFWVKGVLAKLDKYIVTYTDPVVLADKVYKLYLTIPMEKPGKSVEKKLHFGCFRLNNSTYYKVRREVRLHFNPSRKGLTRTNPIFRASDLAPIYMDDRRKEFSQMINHIYQNPVEFAGVTHFVSSSWLQNLPAYRSFFPDSTNVVRTKVDNGYMWLWGQFLKWDLTGNAERLETFRASLKKAKSLKAVVNAIPLQIYEVKIPLEEMFEKYVPGYNEKGTFDFKSWFVEPMPVELGANFLAL